MAARVQRKAVLKDWHAGLAETNASTRNKGDDDITFSGFCLSTGSLMLDLALGGGHGQGKVFNMMGPEKSGKTTVEYEEILFAKFHYDIEPVIYDHEGSFDMVYMQNIADQKYPGLRVDEFIRVEDNEEHGPQNYFCPDHGEWTFSHIGTSLNAYKRIPKADRKPILFVIDSIAAMTPKASMDTEEIIVNDDGTTKVDKKKANNAMGAHSRMMSLGLPKIKTRIRKLGCFLILTNQLRFKIGVMFGCLHADTKVNFVDGRSIPIRTVVEEKIGGEVWSYDEKKDRIVPAKITAWHHNGDVEAPSDWVTITAVGAKMTPNGVASVTVTQDHEIATSEGWTPADEVDIDTRLISTVEPSWSKRLTVETRAALYGALSGDSHLNNSYSKGSLCLQFQDATDPEYSAWKAKLFEPLLGEVTTIPMKNGRGDVHRFPQSWALTHDARKFRRSRDPRRMLRHAHSTGCLAGFAIWLMDDGWLKAGPSHDAYMLSVKRFKGNRRTLTKIRDLIQKVIPATFSQKNGGRRLVSVREVDGTFYIPGARAIADCIRKYVPACMSRKLIDGESAGDSFTIEAPKTTRNRDTNHLRVTSVTSGSDRKFRQRGKYDITVEGHACYLAGGTNNGIIVHNSPETEPGGNAVAHYVDQRVKMQPCTPDKKVAFGTVKVLKQGGISGVRKEDHVSGQGWDKIVYSHGCITKNKIGPPLRNFEMRMIISEQGGQACGIDIIADTAIYLMQTGQMEKKAGYYYLTLRGFNADEGLPTDEVILETGRTTWADMKKLIGRPGLEETICGIEVYTELGEDDAVPLDIRAHCYEQLECKAAAVMYAKFLADGAGGGSSTWAHVVDVIVERVGRKQVLTGLLVEDEDEEQFTLPISQDVPKAKAKAELWRKNPNLIIGKRVKVPEARAIPVELEAEEEEVKTAPKKRRAQAKPKAKAKPKPKKPLPKSKLTRNQLAAKIRARKAAR